MQGPQGATPVTSVATGAQGPQSTARCDVGQFAVGGGFQGVRGIVVHHSAPTGDPATGWQATTSGGAEAFVPDRGAGPVKEAAGSPYGGSGPLVPGDGYASWRGPFSR
ncbi:hypothetical protein [Streptomyces wuyuanensis]|uniref:hypothetical protein n=1 Tax=Streptomyces wuyuanensis TaxID=1196353 RepID=UPI0036C80D93